MVGVEIWPPSHNDPFAKGPQPRILTRRQQESMEKMRSEREVPDTFFDNKENEGDSTWQQK